MLNRYKFLLPPIGIVLLAGLTAFLSYRALINFVHDNFEDTAPVTISNGLDYANMFVKEGYPEIKDLATQLLTLITSSLVFSVTFSQQIIKIGTAKLSVKTFLILGWILLIVAMVSDGMGIALNAFARPIALNDSYAAQQGAKHIAEFYEQAVNALTAIILSGIFFILGIIIIVIAGIFAIFSKTSSTEETKVA